MTYIIHVNRQFIAFNTKYGSPVLPTYIVRHGTKVTYAHGVRFTGIMEFVDPRKHPPLACGARAWASCTGAVECIESMSFKEANALRKKYENRE